jgi:hypothetical protein
MKLGRRNMEARVALPDAPGMLVDLRRQAVPVRIPSSFLCANAETRKTIEGGFAEITAQTKHRAGELMDVKPCGSN